MADRIPLPKDSFVPDAFPPDLGPVHHGLNVTFYNGAVPDFLRTEGGAIPKKHPRVAELRAEGVELEEHPEDPRMLLVPPAGRPHWLDVEFILLAIPGDLGNSPNRPATAEDRRTYAKEYEHFRSGAAGLIGTSLAQWPHAKPAQAKTLVYYGIHTVEQLAEVSDGNLSQIGPYQALRKTARDWVSIRAVEQPKNEVAELKALVAALSARLDGASADPQAVENREDRGSPSGDISGGGEPASGAKDAGVDSGSAARRGPGRPRKTPLPTQEGDASAAK